MTYTGIEWRDRNIAVITAEAEWDSYVEAGTIEMNYDNEIAIISNIRIEDAFQGNGLGTAAIIDIANEEGQVLIMANNHIAEKLYARLGEIYESTNEYPVRIIKARNATAE